MPADVRRRTIRECHENGEWKMSAHSPLSTVLSPLIPPGYKQTEVGVIPEEWNPDYIENFAVITTGSKNTQDRIEDGLYPFFVRSQTVERINSYSFEGEAVLTAGDGVGTGKVFHYINGRFDIHQRVYRISNFAERVNAYFFYLYFSTHFYNRIMQMTAKSSVDSVRRDMISRMQVALPPTEAEQRAIATALSDVDALLARLDRLLVKKRDLKQAAMQQLLTGQTRLPGFKGKWEVKRLGDAGKCLRGVSYKGDSDLSTHDMPHTKRLLRSNNVQNAIVVTDEVQFVDAARVSSHQILQQDDILICMANGSKALVGKAGFFMVVDGHEYTFGAFMGCFRTNTSEANPAFVFYLFLTGRYRDYINNLLAGSSINNLRPSSIESLEFSLPPLPEQTAIAEVLTEMDAELAALEQRREKTRALKQAMMQELLTGKTRLISRGVAEMKP
jgi:type I restriction enzyme S subunit